MILSYFHWDLNPEIINIGGYSLRYYGMLFGLGILLAGYILRKIFDAEGLPRDNFHTLTTYCFFGIVLGARLGHCLFYEPDYYLSRPLEMLLPIAITDDGVKLTGYQGLASHGGILGLIIAVILYSRKTKHAFLSAIDYISVAAGICFTFIRLANFTNSEIIGLPTTVSWAVVFEKIDDVPRHAAQLYEAILYFIVFLIMLVLYKRFALQRRTGVLFGFACVLFFTVRIIVEFFKENQVAFEDQLTFNMGQLLSVPFILVGIGLILNGFRKPLKSTVEAAE